jgi:hypothetical protein
MNIGVLGTGMVGQSIAGKLAQLGHEVTIGTRNVAATAGETKPNPMGMPPFSAWHTANANVRLGTFAEAAAFGEILFNCTNGGGSLEALTQAGDLRLSGKILVDIANPLDFSKGMPPTLSVSNADSLGEKIQRAFPNLKVVKALNTMNAMLMTNPAVLNDGDHTLFVCGNDAAAKQRVADLLGTFGWRKENVLDLGDITNARGVEMILPLWIRLYGIFQSPMFQFKIVRPAQP